MDEYNLLNNLIHRLSDSDAFSEEIIDKLFKELEEANKDGRLDKDLNYASEYIMCLEMELLFRYIE